MSPRCLIVCGFAGGLAPAAEAGDLVLATSVLHSTGGDSPAPTPDPDLLALATSLAIPGVAIRSGPLLTYDRIVTTSVEKRGLAQASGALAVDMETLGAIGVAQDRGVPWLAVRAVSDSVDDDFPLDFNLIADANGDVDRGRVVRAALAHPRSIPGLIRLGRRSALAAGNLAAFLESLLRQLPKG
jgi:nucleoside phosphorylase